jgi:hypothetical protein
MRYFHIWRSRPPIFHGRLRLTCPRPIPDGTWQCRLAGRPWNAVRFLRLSWACRRRKTPGEESRHIGSLTFRSGLVTCDRVCSAMCVGAVMCLAGAVAGCLVPGSWAPHLIAQQHKGGRLGAKQLGHAGMQLLASETCDAPLQQQPTTPHAS